MFIDTAMGAMIDPEIKIVFEKFYVTKHICIEVRSVAAPDSAS